MEEIAPDASHVMSDDPSQTTASGVHVLQMNVVGLQPCSHGVETKLVPLSSHTRLEPP